MIRSSPQFGFTLVAYEYLQTVRCLFHMVAMTNDNYDWVLIMGDLMMCTVPSIPVRGRTEEARDPADEWGSGGHVSSEGEECTKDFVGRARRLWEEDHARWCIISGSVTGGCSDKARGVSVDNDGNGTKGKLSIFRNTLLFFLLLSLLRSIGQVGKEQQMSNVETTGDLLRVGLLPWLAWSSVLTGLEDCQRGGCHPMAMLRRAMVAVSCCLGYVGHFPSLPRRTRPPLSPSTHITAFFPLRSRSLLSQSPLPLSSFLTFLLLSLVRIR